MADIELVVKISEEDYKKVLDTNNREWDWNNMHSCYEAILDGTPLPKGHGRLIDADELKRHKYHDNNRFENAVAVAQIDWADTIIAADKEQEDGK